MNDYRTITLINEFMENNIMNANDTIPSTSWDLLIPLYERIQLLISPAMDGTNGSHENAIGDMGIAILDCDKEEMVKQALIAITWYNTSNRKP